MILPLFIAICEIWLPELTYGVYLVLFLKPGATWPHAIFDQDWIKTAKLTETIVKRDVNREKQQDDDLKRFKANPFQS